MSFDNHPRQVSNYREATDRHTINESNFHRFKCMRCKQSKPIAGRKSIGWKQGFKCADCAKPNP